MSRDRFIYTTERVTRDAVHGVIIGFFGEDGADDIRWDPHQSRFYVDLHGESSRLKIELTARWIEVYVADNQPIDVITRRADDYTNGLADALAKLLARNWSGTRLEME